ncbi:MAG: hypothetical protein LRY50_11390 [Geovibrio sp.]|nr:hypothetical protein [Geovibrio sp.]
MLKKLIVITVVFVMAAGAFAADEVTVAAGAGYRKLVTEMAAYCEKKGRHKSEYVLRQPRSGYCAG